MVRTIFDAIDLDGSGVIEREELASAIMRFDNSKDPGFLDKVRGSVCVCHRMRVCDHNACVVDGLHCCCRCWSVRTSLRTMLR